MSLGGKPWSWLGYRKHHKAAQQQTHTTNAHTRLCIPYPSSEMPLHSLFFFLLSFLSLLFLCFPSRRMLRGPASTFQLRRFTTIGPTTCHLPRPNHLTHHSSLIAHHSHNVILTPFQNRSLRSLRQMVHSMPGLTWLLTLTQPLSLTSRTRDLHSFARPNTCPAARWCVCTRIISTSPWVGTTFSVDMPFTLFTPMRENGSRPRFAIVV